MRLQCCDPLMEHGRGFGEISQNHSDVCLAGGEYRPTSAAPKYNLNDTTRSYALQLCEYRKQPRQEYEWTLLTPENACLPRSLHRHGHKQHPFMAVPYCNTARNLTILFLGDSTAQLMFWSFVHLLKVDGGEEQPLQNVENSGNSALLCDGLTHVLYGRDDNLMAPFVESQVARANPDVLVLNRGIHVVSDSRLQAEMTSLKVALSSLRIRMPRVRLFWRTTLPGHAHCNSTTTLLSERYVVAQPLNGTTQTSSYSAYGWQHVERQNALIRALLDSAPSLPIEYLDAFELSNRRADRHQWYRRRAHGAPVRDCLHYCAPGPVDDWNALLAIKLMQQQSASVFGPSGL